MTARRSFLVFATLLFSCGTPKGEANDKISGSAFFPLVTGSYWHYESYLEGELQEGLWRHDSVVSVSSAEGAVTVGVARRTADEMQELFYQLSKDGMIFLVASDGTKQPFCLVKPKPGSAVDGWHYSEFLDSNSTMIRLETADFESASYEEQLEWQGRTFRKGIGLISFGGADIGMELTEYRIGSEGQGQAYKP